MTTMKRTTMFERTVTAGTDGVVSGIWMPANSICRMARGYLDFHGNTVATSLQSFLGAASLWWLPVDDPDTTGTMDSVWDSQVLKDEVVVSLDLDTQTMRTNAEWEPGAAKWAKLFDVGVEVKHLWRQHFMCNIARNAVGVGPAPDTPFGYEFVPSGHLSPELPVVIRSSTPGLLVVAASSADTVETSSTEAIAGLAEEDWGQLQYIDHVMERAMLNLLGVQEAGAETPWEEATTLLKKYLRPLVFETNSGTFVPITWKVTGEMDYIIEVEGTMGKRVLSLE